MKKLLVLLIATASLRAASYQFTLTGTADYAPAGNPLAGTTFTAEFLVDITVADSNADPAIGNFTQSGASSVVFSNGLTLGGGLFDYVVGNDLFIAPLGGTYDALAFYYYPSGLTLGFEIRLPLATFANDLAQIPSGIIPLDNQNWFYFSGTGFIGGAITGIDVSPVSVPDAASTLACLAIASGIILPVARVRLRR